MSRCRLVLPAFLVTFVAAVSVSAQDSQPRFINPPGLAKPTGYTHVVLGADRRTVYIAGQVAYDSLGALVGQGDFRVQAEQVYANLRTALASVGGSMSDLVKTTTYITNLSNLAGLREIRGRYLNMAQPPANTLVIISSLANPALLIEVEATAILRQPANP